MPDSKELRARDLGAQVGRIPLLLLDSDVPENDHDLRNVTDRLYGATRSTGSNRNCWRALEACVRFVRSPRSKAGPHPMCSMNEGTLDSLGGAHPRVHDRRPSRFRHRADGGAVEHRVHHPHPGSAGSIAFRSRWCRPTFADTGDGALLPDVPVERVRLVLRDDPSKFTWRTWDFGWRSAPTASRCCTARSAARCSTNSGRVRSGRGSDRFDHQRSARPHRAAPQWLELGRELAGSTEEFLRASVWNRIDQVDAGPSLVDQISTTCCPGG